MSVLEMWNMPEPICRDEIADRQPVDIYVLFRGFGFLKLRDISDVDDKLITVRWVDGHGQTHRLSGYRQRQSRYLVHRHPAIGR